MDIPKTLYRGGPDGNGPQWWTPDVAYARFYAGEGEVHEQRVSFNSSQVLDFRALGVDYDEEQAEVIIASAGVPMHPAVTIDAETYQSLEDRDFVDAVFRCGFCAIACWQWHHEYSDQPVEAWLVK